MTTTNPRSSRSGSLRPRTPHESETGGRGGRPRHGATQQSSAESVAATGRRHSDDVVEYAALPPTGLLLARPVLLAACALIGALIGLLVAGNGGYQATATLEFSSDSQDSNVAKQTGQTLARTSTAQQVLAQAAGGLNTTATDLAGRVSAEWQIDTRLVNVTVTAPDQQAAVDAANAVANTVIGITQATQQAALTSALNNSSSVLSQQALPQAAAEDARQAQIGAALGLRQDAIVGDSSALTIADPAVEASTAGLSRGLGAAVGLAAGLLLGALAALLLGLRGLRVTSGRTVRALLPDTEIASEGQVAKLAGEFVETGCSTLAVVATAGTLPQSTKLAEELGAFLRAHGRTVTVVGPERVADRSGALALLGRDVRSDVPGQIGTDLLVPVVPADSDASGLLEGQSDLRALIVVRRRRTSVSRALQALTSFARARPSLVLAK